MVLARLARSSGAIEASEKEPLTRPSVARPLSLKWGLSLRIQFKIASSNSPCIHCASCREEAGREEGVTDQVITRLWIGRAVLSWGVKGARG